MSLASRHGCSVWAWDGFQERRLLSEDMRLRTDYFGARTSSLPTQQLRVDSSLFGSVRDLYLANGAWTWDSTYEPPPSSTYIQLVREGEVLIRPADAPRRGRSLRIAGRSALRAARRGGRLARRAASTMARGDRSSPGQSLLAAGKSAKLLGLWPLFSLMVLAWQPGI